MDSDNRSYPDSPHTLQASADSPSTNNMDAEASGAASVASDPSIKMETSGFDDETDMADIPDLPMADGLPTPTTNKSEPRSSQTPSFFSQLDGSSAAASPSAKPSGAARAAKKKGTAALVKKTPSRRGRGGSRAGRAGRGGARAATSASRRGGRGGKRSTFGPAETPASPPLAATAASSDIDGASEGHLYEESDHGPYCICRGPDDHRWMISCDVCEDWFHGECVGVDKTIGEALIVRYVCPGCTDNHGINVTRYKKTCALEGCLNAARMYEDGDAGRKGAVKPPAYFSVFCSDRHADEWWELLVRSFPEKTKAMAKGAELTREQFMGLLDGSNLRNSIEGEVPWNIGKIPFDVPSDFWSKVDRCYVLTPEEEDFLTTSASDRYALAEEIVLNKKMQQLLDLANERRRAAISAGLLEKDVCGYDCRLDVVGCPDEFSIFARSAQGEVIYRGNSLAAEGSFTDEQLWKAREDAEAAGKELNMETAGMCERRRCKPHASWYNTFTRSTRLVIKELARQAKEKLDAETRVKEAAATKYLRLGHEEIGIRRLDVE